MVQSFFSPNIYYLFFNPLGPNYDYNRIKAAKRCIIITSVLITLTARGSILVVRY